MKDYSPCGDCNYHGDCNDCLIEIKSTQIDNLKCCGNCGSDDGYDCRSCTLNNNPDKGKPLQDHWIYDGKTKEERQ